MKAEVEVKALLCDFPSLEFLDQALFGNL